MGKSGDPKGHALSFEWSIRESKAKSRPWATIEWRNSAFLFVGELAILTLLKKSPKPIRDMPWKR